MEHVIQELRRLLQDEQEAHSIRAVRIAAGRQRAIEGMLEVLSVTSGSLAYARSCALASKARQTGARDAFTESMCQGYRNGYDEVVEVIGRYDTALVA